VPKGGLYCNDREYFVDEFFKRDSQSQKYDAQFTDDVIVVHVKKDGGETCHKSSTPHV
jgi:hypothetical protein